jgi:hypothetical protein
MYDRRVIPTPGPITGVGYQDWTGFRLGINGGAGWAWDDHEFARTARDPPGDFRTT